MLSVAIFVPDNSLASTVGGFADILQVANSHLRKQRRTEKFEWEFVSIEGGKVTTSNGLKIDTKRIDQRTHYQIIFIPSLHYTSHQEFTLSISQQSSILQWLQEAWRNGTWIAANCTGTFILAETGLLNGREATTTWWLEQQFRKRYPKVHLNPALVITESDRLSCAGASASFLTQVVRIIKHFVGASIASEASKTMLIDMSQASQVPYLPLLAESEHADELVQKAEQILRRSVGMEFRISDLAAELSVSERTLVRRFKAALKVTPINYFQDLRLEAARTLLEFDDRSIENVANQVGYSDTSSFTRLFRERIGMTPKAYRERFLRSGPD